MYAAPSIRTAAHYRFVDRLRDGIVLGVGIPLGLATIHLLYSACAWIALAAFACVAAIREKSSVDSHGASSELKTPYVTIAAIALVAWPPLMRPILEGDSASYHLPIAAAWVHAHSLWTVDARYWWYPPASESFASGILSVAGPAAVNWSGLAAMLLLALRLYEWMREELNASRWLADSLVAATITVFPIAAQAGTLQNDVWLAAFFVDSLRCMTRSDKPAAIRSAVVLSLIKPFGFVFACLAAAVSRARPFVWVAISASILLWALHDGMLWNLAIVPIWGPAANGKWYNSIASNGLPALWAFFVATASVSPFAFVALLTATVGPLVAGQRLRFLGVAAAAAVAILLLTPLVTHDWYQQLAAGQSLRFASPAIALGALLLTPIGMRKPRVAIALLLVSSLYGSLAVLQTYWNDLPTLGAVAVSAGAVTMAIVCSRGASRWIAAAGFAIAVIASAVLIARIPATYYTDGWRVHGTSTGIYAWIERTKPAAVGGWGLRLGAVNELSPGSRTVDLADDTACTKARSLGLLLIAISEDDRPQDFNAARLASARSCGRRLYDDGVGVVVDP